MLLSRYRNLNWRQYLVNTQAKLIDLEKEFKILRIAQVPDLQHRDTVELAWRAFRGKHIVDESRTPLVLIHGLFGSKQNFGSVGRRICGLTRRLVVGLDMRNHGSSPHAMPHDYMHMAKDTIRHIEGMDRKVILGGHLMGAKVSMLVSLLRPELVEKLVVIDHSPVSERLDIQFTQDLLGLCHVVRSNSLRDSPRTTFLQRVDSILFEYEKDPLIRLFLSSNISRTKSAFNKLLHIQCCVPVLNFLRVATLIEMEKWPHIMRGLKFNGPVKIMRGKKSPFVLDCHLETDFPKYYSIILVADFDAGHWVISEQPNRFVKEIVDFIET